MRCLFIDLVRGAFIFIQIHTKILTIYQIVYILDMGTSVAMPHEVSHLILRTTSSSVTTLYSSLFRIPVYFVQHTGMIY